MVICHNSLDSEESDGARRMWGRNTQTQIPPEHFLGSPTAAEHDPPLNPTRDPKRCWDLDLMTWKILRLMMTQPAHSSGIETLVIADQSTIVRGCERCVSPRRNNASWSYEISTPVSLIPRTRYTSATFPNRSRINASSDSSLIFIFSPPSFDPLNCGVMMYSECDFANSRITGELPWRPGNSELWKPPTPVLPQAFECRLSKQVRDPIRWFVVNPCTNHLRQIIGQNGLNRP